MLKIRAGSAIYYQDRKGYEDPWRKHHQSSIARDLWVYDSKNGSHKQLTTFAGEDRNPVVDTQENFMYYLSEKIFAREKRIDQDDLKYNLSLHDSFVT